MAEGEEAPKFSFGCAKFTLKDFLINKHVHTLKLRSDVFPVKKAVAENLNQQDLNTTARKAERTIEKSSPYLINATYAVLAADLSYPIGSFDEEAEIKRIKEQQEDSKIEEGKATPG